MNKVDDNDPENPGHVSPPKTSPGRTLKHLADENKDLRAQLRLLNAKLDEVIQNVTDRPKPAQNTSTEELKTALKHEKISARVAKLSEPSFRVQLERSVMEQEAKVRELENKIMKLRKFRRQREKVLESVLETGQTPEMVAALGDLQATIVITARKVAETEKRNKQIAEVFTKLGERESALQKELAEAEAAGINLKPEPVHSAPEHPPPNAELVSSMKRLENSLARKRVMVHTLENELKSAQETLSACNLKLQRLSSDLDTKAGEVQNMSEIMDQQITHRRIRSNPVRKVFVTDR